jgi:UDP-N-acetylglucosamine 4,6-dehydratase
VDGRRTSRPLRKQASRPGGGARLAGLDGKTILVTGGTGSFGKVFIKTILHETQVRRVVVFSRDELKQFEMQQQFQGED